MISRALLCAVLVTATSPAHAQRYPSKPIKVIVPAAPGGGFDAIGRAIGERLSQQLGQPFVIENRTGAGTVVGTDAAHKAAPDGYTLLVGSLSNLAFNSSLYRNLPYDARDFALIGIAASYS